MPQAKSSVRHDLTSLFAFVDSVSKACVSKNPAAAYTPAAERFFGFISDLSTKTKEYLSGWSVSNDAEFEDRRAELQTIRSVWKQFHSYIKPTLDADTLHSPHSVIGGIIRRTRELPNLSDLDIALFLTADPAYIQVYVDSFHTNAQKIRAVIPDAPEFPKNLAVIGLPYSQDSAVFPNCLIAHELGHHVGNLNDVRAKLEFAASATLRARLGSQYAQVGTMERTGWVRTVATWAEEVFCDSFGIMLLGPCFAYAYIDHFDLCAVLDASGTIVPYKLTESSSFYKKYPSHYFRIQQQAALLRGLPWWDSLSKLKSHVSGLLQQALNIPDATHVGGSKMETGFVEALIDVLPVIRHAIGELFVGVDDGWSEYAQLSEEVKSYLKHGVVPSSLVVTEGSAEKSAVTVHPSPLLLLNSGMEFYLTELDGLIESIPGENSASYKCRLHWLHRIEQWIAKAIEDGQLTRGAD